MRKKIGGSIAPVRTTLYRKGLFGIYANSGYKDVTTRPGTTSTITWNVSGTKDTKAKWTNTATGVGYVVIGTFSITD